MRASKLLAGMGTHTTMGPWSMMTPGPAMRVNVWMPATLKINVTIGIMEVAIQIGQNIADYVLMMVVALNIV